MNTSNLYSFHSNFLSASALQRPRPPSLSATAVTTCRPNLFDCASSQPPRSARPDLQFHRPSSPTIISSFNLVIVGSFRSTCACSLCLEKTTEGSRVTGHLEQSIRTRGVLLALCRTARACTRKQEADRRSAARERISKRETPRSQHGTIALLLNRRATSTPKATSWDRRIRMDRFRSRRCLECST